MFASFEGIMGASRKSTYSHHSGSCTARERGEGDRLNRAYGVPKIKEAQRSVKMKNVDVLHGYALADANVDVLHGYALADAQEVQRSLEERKNVDIFQGHT